MAQKKQTITHNGALSKGKTNTATGGTVTPQALDCKDVIEDTGFLSSLRIATRAWSPLLYKGQIFQMLVDMKEQIKE